MKARFQIYKDKAREFRFCLVAPNGEIIASSEGYSSKQACEAGVAAVKKYAPDAEVEEESQFLMRIARNSGHYDRNGVAADQGDEIGGGIIMVRDGRLPSSRSEDCLVVRKRGR